MTRTLHPARLGVALRRLMGRLFPPAPRPPRQSDIERALLRALGGL